MRVFQQALQKRAELHQEGEVKPLPLAYYVHKYTDTESETDLSHFPTVADPQRTLIDRKNFFESVLHDRDFPLLTTFLLGGIDINTKRPEDQATALHLAVLGEANYDKLYSIIHTCVNYYSATTNIDMTSYEAAIAQNDSGNVCGKCNVNAAGCKPSYGKRVHKKNGYVFDFPCENGLILSFLIDNNADMNAQLAFTGATPLMLAAAIQNTQAIKLLVQKGADWHVKDLQGRSVLSYAARYPHILMCLAELIGKEVLLAQLQEENILHELCRCSGKSYNKSSNRFPVLFLVEYLELDINAPINVSNNMADYNKYNNNKNSQDECKTNVVEEYYPYEQHQHQEEQEELINVNSNTTIPLDQRVELGTELSSTSTTSVNKNLSSLPSHYVGSQAILQKDTREAESAYLHHFFKPGSTALHCAIESGDVNLVKALIQTGKANMSVKNAQGQTPLQLAESLYKAHRKFIPSWLSWLSKSKWEKEMKLRQSKGKKYFSSASSRSASFASSLVQKSIHYPLALLTTFLYQTFNTNAVINDSSNFNRSIVCSQEHQKEEEEIDDDEVPCATINYSAIYSFLKNYQKNSFVRDQSQRLLLLPLTEEMETEYASRVCGINTGKLRCLQELTSLCTTQTLCQLVMGFTLPHVFLLMACLVFRRFIFLLGALVLVTLGIMHIHVNSNTRSTNKHNNKNGKKLCPLSSSQRSLTMLGIALGFFTLQAVLLPLYSTHTYYKYYSVTFEGDALLKYWLLPVAIITILLLSYVFCRPPYVVSSSAGQRKGLYSLFMPIASVNLPLPVDIANEHGEIIKRLTNLNNNNNNSEADKEVLQTNTLEKIYSVDFNCMVKKPLRAQYCAQVQQVVLRYDHYCNYLASVIAGHNHRAFVYGHLALLILLSTFYFFAFHVRQIFFTTTRLLERQEIAQALPRDEMNALKLLLPFGINTPFYRFAYLYTQFILPMMIGIVGFQLVQQLYYILRNLTLYEVRHATDECSVYCFVLNHTVYSLYDRGWWRNLSGFCAFMESFASRAYRPPAISSHLRRKIAEEERIAAAQRSLSKKGASCGSKCCAKENNCKKNDSGNTNNNENQPPITLEETALNLYNTSLQKEEELEKVKTGHTNDINNNNDNNNGDNTSEQPHVAMEVIPTNKDSNTNAHLTNLQPHVPPTTNVVNNNNNNNIYTHDNSSAGATPTPPLAQYLFQEMIRNGSMEIASLSSEGVNSNGNTVLNDHRSQQEWDEAVLAARKMYSFFQDVKRKSIAAMYGPPPRDVDEGGVQPEAQAKQENNKNSESNPFSNDDNVKQSEAINVSSKNAHVMPTNTTQHGKEVKESIFTLGHHHSNGGGVKRD